jgi:hypothetical protein
LDGRLERVSVEHGGTCVVSAGMDAKDELRHAGSLGRDNLDAPPSASVGAGPLMRVAAIDGLPSDGKG